MESPALTGNGERLLVVDDESPVREVIGMILEAHGYTCCMAEDGAEALDVYLEQRNEIAAVITDLNMPRVDGISLIRSLRAYETELKVIVSSGHISPERREALEELGVRGVLAKPYTSQELLKCVRGILEQDAPVAAFR